MLPMLLATIENDADRALFAEIYEQYHERMEQAALRILKDTHDAEDAVQNAFLKIIRNFEKFLELPCKKRPFWCVCIVKNEAITLLRKKKKAIMLESMEDAYDASADIEKALFYEDIIRLFAGLPETYRAVLEMKFLLDCSGKDISQKLGISENAVNVRISRGRAKLDAFMSKVLLDAIAFDEDRLEEKIPYAASARHRRQMRAMLKDPVRWTRERGKPVWKRVLQTAAVILLMLSLGLGSVMLASPTARATIVRWVTEWYETHIVFRYAGEDAPGEMPRYELGELPEGFVENLESQFVGTGMTAHFYENEKGDVILFEYIYMQQGSSSGASTENAYVVSVSINRCEGLLVIPKEENSNSMLMWFDPEHNLQFTLDAPLGQEDILHMAESVYLVETTK